MRGRIQGIEFHSTCYQIILSLLERCPLVRGRIQGIEFHSTCYQIILSLLEGCPLARVSFKRGTTVNCSSKYVLKKSGAWLC